MGIVENVKDAVSLVQKVDNIELYRKILDLQAEVMTLVQEKNDLKAKLRIADDFQVRDNSYFRSTGEGPFCSRCWDADAKLIRLTVRRGYKPQCPNCDKFFGSSDDGPVFA